MTQEQMEKAAELGQKIANLQEAKNIVPEIAKAVLKYPKTFEERLEQLKNLDDRVYTYIAYNTKKYLEKLCEDAVENMNRKIEECVEAMKHIEEPEQPEIG